MHAFMKAFQALFDRLDRMNGTNAKVTALAEHFRSTPAADGAWALQLLLGKRRRRLITGRRLRDILRDRGGLPEWLIADCHGQVGDSAETISLLWPAVKDRIQGQATDLPSINPEQPLHWWMDTLLPAIGALKDDKQADAVIHLWHAVPDERHFIVNKLLTGGFRVGVSTGLISRALATAFELEDTLVVQRLMGGFTPSASAFLALSRPEAPEEQQSSGVPYPFFLASPLEPERLVETPASDWRVEWKWDGIRGQLIHRGTGVYLWSRGEELVNDSFPELVTVGDALPDGTALDGEIIRRIASIVFFFDGPVANLQVVFAIGPEGSHVIVKAAGPLGEVGNQFAERLILHQHGVGVDAGGKFELIQRPQIHGVRDSHE